MRRSHWLSNNKRGELPVRMAFVDCETKSEQTEDRFTVEAKLWFGCATYVRRKRDLDFTTPEHTTFFNAEELYQWVDSKTAPKTKLYIFAHNLGFDATVGGLFDKIAADGYKADNPIIDDPPTVITYHKDTPQGSKSIILIDTLNWFRVPLAVLGKNVGIDKLDMPLYTAPFEMWERYCQTDNLIIMFAMMEFMKFVREHDLGNFGKTLPGQAMAAYKHRFKYGEGIFLDDNEKALDLSREAYHGGRVEVFRKGKIPGRVSCFDINSMYPSVMAREEFPMRLVSYQKSMTKEQLHKVIYDKGYGVVAKIDIETDVALYAYPLEGKLIFPIGTFTTYLSTPEVKEAFKRGHIRKVYDVAIYEMAPIFTEYVDYFWKLRKKAKASGSKLDDYMLKLFLNSLYGKFGQNGRVFKDIREVPEKNITRRWSVWDAETRTKRTFRQFQGTIQEETVEGESLDSFPAIAAHVTAYGRVELFRLFEKAGLENVYYCDTDSLFVNDEGRERLSDELDEELLGALKLEWESELVELRGNKDYKNGTYEKIKGIRATALKLWITVDICELCGITYVNPDEFNYNTYRQVRFMGLTGKIGSNKLNTQEITMITKIYKRNYDKGVVTASGVILPWFLEDGMKMNMNMEGE